MSCLPKIGGSKDHQFKNEYAVTFIYRTGTAAKGNKQLSPDLPAAVAAMRGSKDLIDWTVTPDVGNKQTLESNYTTTRLRVLLSHKYISMTTSAEAAKDIRMMYKVMCNITFRGKDYALIWEDNLFKWQIGLANNKTAISNSVWSVSPTACSKYRSASAAGDLGAFLEKYRHESRFDARPLAIAPGASVNMSNRGRFVESVDTAGKAIKKIRKDLKALDGVGAQNSVAALYIADSEMRAALEGMLGAQVGTGKTNKDVSDEKKGIKAFADDASVDTLVGTLDEVYDEKTAGSKPAPSSPGFFQRFFENRKQKRNARLALGAKEKLSQAQEKMDDIETALERLEGHYLYSVNLHSIVMVKPEEVSKLIKAAHAESGRSNVDQILYFLHGNSARYYIRDMCLGGKEGLDSRCLEKLRGYRTKKLSKKQAKYAKQTGEVLRLLDASARLRTKAGIPVESC
ncbi:hypothetical protein F5X68DRAFT_251312 [Plectosphaerella plurivora]|uniref:Uncharacterized protein n=1 Tax=Plectosphaerella plurivora TaxID=936078 RepID=A0A9P9A645_9PEZI|nr:hypothetical protein F5X68DRAFT_251312 [Plectosphaerella plurivora]